MLSDNYFVIVIATGIAIVIDVAVVIVIVIPEQLAKEKFAATDT